VLRDELIGHEARLREARAIVKVFETERLRYEKAIAEYAADYGKAIVDYKAAKADYEAAKGDVERLLNTRTGRLLRTWHRLRGLLLGRSIGD
jgi:exonuclease VII small subunit